jgi:hypothetical protein
MRLNLSAGTTSIEEQQLARELKKVEAASEYPPNRISVARKQHSQSPIDEERRRMRWRNRQLSVDEVLDRLRNDAPSAMEYAEIVGTWIWITFQTRPDAAIREKLCDIGFIWNQKRGAWMHSCGAFTPHSKSHPKTKYATIAAGDYATATKVPAEETTELVHI